MTVIWHMYGGRDFQPLSSDSGSLSSSPAPSPHATHRLGTDSYQNAASQSSSTQDQFYTGRTRSNSGGNGRTRSADVANTTLRNPSSPRGSRGHSGGAADNRKKQGRRAPSDWRVAGGPGRDHSILMELELDKVVFSKLPRTCTVHCTCTCTLYMYMYMYCVYLAVYMY